MTAPVFWFTGLSGAGKSTIAEAAKAALEAEGRRVLIIDGDDVRERLHRHLGFSEADIKLNNSLIAGLCEELRGGVDAVLVPVISPYRVSRDEARRRLGPAFYEIHMAAPVDVVAARDVKGLYAKARSGELSNLVGFSPGTVYEAPEAADLVIHSGAEDQSASSNRFLSFVRDQMDPPSPSAKHDG